MKYTIAWAWRWIQEGTPRPRKDLYWEGIVSCVRILLQQNVLAQYPAVKTNCKGPKGTSPENPVNVAWTFKTKMCNMFAMKILRIHIHVLRQLRHSITAYVFFIVWNSMESSCPNDRGIVASLNQIVHPFIITVPHSYWCGLASQARIKGDKSTKCTFCAAVIDSWPSKEKSGTWHQWM